MSRDRLSSVVIIGIGSECVSWIFALPAEVFSSCLAVLVGGLFLWPALRYGTGYQTVWEIRPSAETTSSVHWRRFYFQLTRVHSALELFGRCALQSYLLTYLLIYLNRKTVSICFYVMLYSVILDASMELTVLQDWSKDLRSWSSEARSVSLQAARLRPKPKP